jgi:hypothetical protein
MVDVSPAIEFDALFKAPLLIGRYGAILVAFLAVDAPFEVEASAPIEQAHRFDRYARSFPFACGRGWCGNCKQQHRNHTCSKNTQGRFSNAAAGMVAGRVAGRVVGRGGWSGTLSRCFLGELCPAWQRRQLTL